MNAVLGAENGYPCFFIITDQRINKRNNTNWKQAGKQIRKRIGKQIGKQAGKQIGKLIGKHIGKLIGKQIDVKTILSITTICNW